MTKSLSLRLTRAEEAADQLKLWQRKCRRCQSPVPSILSSLLLGPAGLYRAGAQCADCCDEGGGGHLGIHPETGEPDGESKLVLLGMGFEAWLDLHGEKRFGGAVDLTLEHYRAEYPAWADKLDLSVPRTPAQCAEAKAATRTFPNWGDPREELARLSGDVS